MGDEVEAAAAFRRSVLWSGAISLAMGVVLLVWPQSTLLVVAALIGVFLVLWGIVRLLEAFRPGLPGGVRALRAVIGVLLIVVGVACLRNLAGSITVLAVLIGIGWIIGGIAEVAFGFTHGGTGASRAGAIVIGLLYVVGGLVLFFWPQTSLTVLVWVVGLWLVAIGIVQLVLGFMARGHGHAAGGPRGAVAH